MNELRIVLNTRLNAENTIASTENMLLFYLNEYFAGLISHVVLPSILFKQPLSSYAAA